MKYRLEKCCNLKSIPVNMICLSTHGISEIKCTTNPILICYYNHYFHILTVKICHQQLTPNLAHSLPYLLPFVKSVRLKNYTRYALTNVTHTHTHTNTRTHSVTSRAHFPNSLSANECKLNVIDICIINVIYVEQFAVPVAYC